MIYAQKYAAKNEKALNHHSGVAHPKQFQTLTATYGLDTTT